MKKNLKFNGFIVLLLMSLLTAHCLLVLRSLGVVGLLTIFVTDVYGDTHTAATCNQPDVQAEVDASSDGDTVMVPPGVSTWTVSVYINAKAVTVKGAGGGQTKIHDATDNFNNNHPFDINGIEGKPFRITGFSFTSSGVNTWDDYNIIINIRGTCKNWRIDHSTFSDVTSAVETNGGSYTYGVIDHCYFVVPTSSSICYPMVPTMMHIFSDNAAAWQRPLTLGTSQALYIEDCIFDYGDNINIRQLDNTNAMHCSNGGRYVFRHNYVKNTKVEQFGACTNGGRGGVSGEVYDNTFYYELNYPCIGGFEGGTGVYFNNTAIIGGSFWIPFLLYDYRPCSGTGCLPPMNSNCDGSSSLDGNMALESGAHTGSDNASVLTCSGKSWTANQWADYYIYNLTDGSRGEVTSNTSNTITAVLSSGTQNDWDKGDTFKLTNGYPCIDQTGLGPSQSFEPIYEWNNTINGGDVDFTVNSGGCSINNYLTAYIKEGRDFYNDTQRPGYTPYQYPHPLTLEYDTTPPTMPPVVRDGTSVAEDSGFTYSTTTLSANWDNSADSESGISRYYFAIGSSPGATDITGWTDNGNAVAVIRTGLLLTAGATYYFKVKAQNGLGLQGLPNNSNGQYIAIASTGNNPAPVPPAVSPISAVYPNPYNFSNGEVIKFKAGSSGSEFCEVKIYTMNGKLVRTVTVNSGSGVISWDGRNADGQKVSRGIYLYKMINNNGDSITGKLAVVK